MRTLCEANGSLGYRRKRWGISSSVAISASMRRRTFLAYKVGGSLFERTLASSGNVLKSLGDFGIQL